MLPKLAEMGDTRVVQDTKPLKTSLTCLEKKSKLVVRGNLRLLVSVFSHGKIDDGIIIGEASSGRDAPKNSIGDLIARLHLISKYLCS